MSDFGQAAGAVGAVANLVNNILNSSQANRSQALYDHYQKIMDDFVSYVLSLDRTSVDLLINGLGVRKPLPELTADQFSKLKSVSVTIDGSTLVNLFCRAAQGDYANDLANLVSNYVNPTAISMSDTVSASAKAVTAVAEAVKKST